MGFIKVYENVMNLYAFFNVITEMKHFQSIWGDLEVFVILWLPRVDNISIMAFISELHKDEMIIFVMITNV